MADLSSFKSAHVYNVLGICLLSTAFICAFDLLSSCKLRNSATRHDPPKKTKKQQQHMIQLYIGDVINPLSCFNFRELYVNLDKYYNNILLK